MTLKVRFGLAALVVLAVAWGFNSMLFEHIPNVFNDPKEDMSFAWYVPIFSLYVLWTERRQLFDSLGEPSWLGALMVVPAVFVGFLGVRGIQTRLAILSLVGLLIVVPWAFFGRATAKRFFFPAIFLLFCVPLASFLDIITVHLRLFAVSSAYAVLQGFGAAVTRTGTAICATDGSFAIDVAAPCSGLRSIFALMALTAGYAYFNQPTSWRRLLLFALSVPLAILGNVMRILSIVLVGTIASPDFATGFYHDYSGYVVFIVAIALMVASGELINLVCRRFSR